MGLDDEKLVWLNTTDIQQVNEIKVSATRRFDTDYFGRRVEDDELKAYIRAGWARGFWTDGQLVGICLARAEGAELHIDFIGIRQEFQRRRYGLRLMNDVLTSAHRREMERVTLVTSKSSPSNIPYYERLGFNLLDEENLPHYLKVEIQRQTSSMKAFPLLLPRVAMTFEIPSRSGRRSVD